MSYVFKSEIKNKKCKHKWQKLKSTVKINNWFLNERNKIEIEYEYLFCPKCGSKVGDDIKW